jgi:predicted enzyme related to lactoylglutathione lyase
MRLSLDHAHIFASDLEATVSFFRKMFDAAIVWDEEAAGARNVRLALGRGFIHVYDQPPKSQHGVLHHLGIETDDLHALVRRMNANGVSLRNPVRDTPTFSYVMTAGPDKLLLELFECREPQRWQITA